MNNPNAITLTESEHTLRLRIIGAKSPSFWERTNAAYLTEPYGGSWANVWHSVPGKAGDHDYINIWVRDSWPFTRDWDR